MPKTYVDNAENRRLGRVGMPHGSMPVSRNGGSARAAGGRGTSSASPTPRSGTPGASNVYTDNAYNRSVGRVGMPLGSMVIQKSSGHDAGKAANNAARAPSPELYADNASNRRLGRAGLPKGSVIITKSEKSLDKRSQVRDQEAYQKAGSVSNNLLNGGHRGSSSQHVDRNNGARPKASGPSPKVYVDNPENRRLGRVGMPHGSAVIYRRTENMQLASDVKLYADNPQNRKLGRVGMPVGTAVFSKKTNSLMKQTYDDSSLNRKLNRVGQPRGSAPVQKKRPTTKKIPELLERLNNDDEFKEFTFDYRDSDDGHYLLNSDTVLVEAFDQAMFRHNRLMEEMSWMRHTVSSERPRTEVSVLKDYKGKKIPFAEIKLRRRIGRGGFGEVYFAKWKETVVAVKKLLASKISSKRIEDFAKEVMKFCTLDHPNIVKFIGACVEVPDLCIVMEYMQMSLYDGLHIRNDIRFTFEERLDILQQTCQGMKYLHEQAQIAHCDLKTDNVLMDYVPGELCEVKITDFGLSMVKQNTDTASTEELVQNVGTPRFSAPEMLRGECLNQKDMLRADVYSLSLVMLEVVFEEEPFHDLKREELREQVGQRGRKPEIPEDPRIESRVKRVIEDGLSYEAKDRPSMTDVCGVLERVRHIVPN